ARDTAQVDARLADVRAAAEGSANLVPRFIEAVDAGATVGEICAVLRSVFGQYVARERIA
ncbi:MAG: methylmalonyl-CoA mutase family protein, partial [Candidatus Velthaea sp.]